VNQERFAEGKRNYRSGNFAQAAQDFLESAEPGIARGNGLAFHQAGNAFMQLGRLDDALTMYQNALRDDTYDSMSGVYSNIGHVYAKQKNYNASAEAYELAATYPECEKPYKCHLRVAQNHMKLGSVDKAAISYKKAALDVGNPARSKALYNLALCLLELKQPLSAVESLKLALDFPDCENRGNVFSSLGIAYALLDSDEEAVEAFEHAQYALGDGGMSPVALAAYAAAKARMAAQAPHHPILEEAVAEDNADEDDGDLSRTGEIRSIDMGDGTDAQLPEGFSAIGTAEDVAQFFALSEDELLEQSKQLAKADKKRMAWWKIVLGIIVGLLLLSALAVGVAYYLGLGYPAANDVVWGSLNAYGNEVSVDRYWVSGATDAEREMASAVPRQAIFDIKSPTGRMNESVVEVIATDAQDNQTPLRFNLVRDGFGWKIKSVHRALD